MFDKLKQGRELLRLRQQAKQLQEEMEKVEHIEERSGMKVKVNGTQKVEYIEINGERREDIENVINDAMKAVQKKAAKKMLEAGGGLGGLLGGNLT